MMEIQYIIDNEGDRRAVVLPIKNYEILFKSVIDFATLAYLNPAVQLLNLPENVTKFIRLLINACDENWKSEFTLTYEEIAASNNCSTKTIQRGRKDLECYMKSETGKAVVNIEQTSGKDGKVKPTKYKLNIIFSIHTALTRLVEKNEIDLTALVVFTKLANTFSLEELHQHNQRFGKLIKIIEQELSMLSDEPKIIKPSAIIGRELS
jgi:hypothetical protein